MDTEKLLKVQTSIRIDPDLLNHAKHVAVDEKMSLSALVSKVLADYLKEK